MKEHEHNQNEFQELGIAFDEHILEALEKHIEIHYGDNTEVFHEIVSDVIHIDVHIVRPCTERNYFTLITSGLSYLPMPVPEGYEAFTRSELILCLPPEWPVLEGEYQKEKYWWPFRLIKELARLPHELDTYITPGTTIPNGDPLEPYSEETELCCAMTATPLLVDESFTTLDIDDQRISFQSIIPIYKEEMDFKLKNELDALLMRFEKKVPDISELINPKRKNACKKWWR